MQIDLIFRKMPGTMLKYLLCLILILFATVYDLHAQDLLKGNDLSTVKIDNLSDADIAKFQSQMLAAGITMPQAEQIAISKGMPQAELSKLIERLARLSNNKAPSTKDTTPPATDRQVQKNEYKTFPKVPAQQGPANLFGPMLFNTPSLSFEPNLRIAIPNDYALGPDDELVISVFGYQEATLRIRVQAEGTITIPQVGVLIVSGLTIENATKLIRDKMSRTAYPNIRAGLTDITVTLGNIRSIHITILGAAKPGNYTVSSLTTVFNSLYLCGGPNELGSFRQIELIRKNEVAERIDLYEFLMKGEQKGNTLLKEGDVINFPVYKKRVTIGGQVKRPGVYEMREEETLDKLIYFAGGFTEKAYTASVKIKQLTDIGRKIKDLTKADFTAYQPGNGDDIQVEMIVDKLENSVTIAGAVYRPGQFELTSGLTLKQLIKNADGVKEDVFLDRGLLTRTKEDLTKESISFQLKDVLSGKKDIVLQRGDNIRIASVSEFRNEYQVTIQGEVRKPGAYPFADNLTLKDLLFQSGGFTEAAFTERGILTRIKDDLTKENIAFPLKDVLAGGEGDIVLRRGDNIQIASVNEFRDELKVTIQGEVRKPGTFPYADKLTLKDLVFQSGGFTEAASTYRIEVGRRINSDQATVTVDSIAEVFDINTEKELGVKGDQFQLKPFDIITVRKKPGYIEQKTVSITGEVLYPGTYTIQSKKERISDLFKRAGGLTPFAFPQGVSLNRVYVYNPKLTKEKIAKAELISQSINDTSTTALEDITAVNSQIVIDMNQVLQHPGSKEDYILEEEDIITVPKLDPLVKISGEVFQSTKTNYEDHASVRYYLSRAGGATDNARLSKTYVLYPNGQIAKTNNGIFGLFRSYPRVTTGSEIVVPKKLARKKLSTGETIGITSAFVSLASLIIITISTLNR